MRYVLFLGCFLLASCAYAQNVTVSDKIDENSYYEKTVVTYEDLIQEKQECENNIAYVQSFINKAEADIDRYTARIAEIDKIIEDLKLKAK
ncbi:MAG: hypothetical protein KKD77_20640 [Gammaproteobacteria bacterium]|nr:hypothetical protein [Gammaproteobacteria bacterium]